MSRLIIALLLETLKIFWLASRVSLTSYKCVHMDFIVFWDRKDFFFVRCLSIQNVVILLKKCNKKQVDFSLPENSDNIRKICT